MIPPDAASSVLAPLRLDCQSSSATLSASIPCAAYLRRERDRIEDRIHRLLKEFEARRASMVAQARTLVERETAQVIDAAAIN